MSRYQLDIYNELAVYAHAMNGGATRWDCVNYCIGYYGKVDANHVKAIQALVKEGVINP